MNLSNKDLLIIQQTIEESPISRESMKENIIDHLSCAVEFKMTHGWDFEEAFSEVLQEFAPNGLREIEHETYLLLNIKTITMKKLTYLSGLIFSTMASAGLVTYFFRMPLRNELLITGFGGVLLIFMPLLLISRQPAAKTPFERKKDRVAIISFLLFSLGGVLKGIHVPSANETLIIGAAVFTFGYLPMLFLKMYRESIAG
jgi:hypothetical protein